MSRQLLKSLKAQSPHVQPRLLCLPARASPLLLCTRQAAWHKERICGRLIDKSPSTGSFYYMPGTVLDHVSPTLSTSTLRCLGENEKLPRPGGAALEQVIAMQRPGMGFPRMYQASQLHHRTSQVYS